MLKSPPAQKSCTRRSHPTARSTGCSISPRRLRSRPLSSDISAAETLGVGGRAGYYEEAGALRDMVANHLLQLLALTAMEPPVAFDADSVREEKVQVFRSIRPMTPEEVARRTVRGQYGAGRVEGEDVPAYRDEPGVKQDSNTETFVAIEFCIENWRWAG